MNIERLLWQKNENPFENKKKTKPKQTNKIGIKNKKIRSNRQQAIMRVMFIQHVVMNVNDLMTVEDLRQEILNKAAEENVEEELCSVKPNLKPGHWVLVLLRAKRMSIL